MLLEAAGILFAAAQAFDGNDVSRNASDNQLRAAEIRKVDNDAQRKHERNMAIINGVFGLLNSYANSVNTTSVSTTNNNNQRR